MRQYRLNITFEKTNAVRINWMNITKLSFIRNPSSHKEGWQYSKVIMHLHE